MRASRITVNEASQLFNATRATNKLRGSLAEVGVYRGGTAKIICEAKGVSPLYLFDTFEGLPEAEQRKRRWVLSRRSVFLPLINIQKYLRTYSNVNFFKGIFPSTGKSLENVLFSFIHLDVDLFDYTLRSLEFFIRVW